MAYGKKAAGNSQGEDVQIDLGKNKQVTVRQYNGVTLVDIREYYMDKNSGEMRPGKKGISLTQDSWNVLLENLPTIKKALKKINGEVDSEDEEKDEEKEKFETEKIKKEKEKLDEEEEDDDDDDDEDDDFSESEDDLQDELDDLDDEDEPSPKRRKIDSEDSEED